MTFGSKFLPTTLFEVDGLPKRTTVRQLERGVMGLFRDFYSETEYVRRRRRRRCMEIVKARET